jgi:hypothetical protein
VATPPKVSENPQVQRHYLAQLALSAAVVQAVRQLWGSTSPLSSSRAFESFSTGVSVLVEQFSQAAASMAADYYAETRLAAGVPGEPHLTLVESPPQSLVTADLNWAFRAQEFTDDYEARILARAEVALEKAVLDASRDQVIAAVQGDDRALGFRRVARPDACAFCLTLAMRRSTRGGEHDQHLGVYKTRTSAGQILSPNTLGEVNRFHNNCHCSVEPVFTIGDAAAPAWLAEMDRFYATSTAGSKKGQRLNDFRRALAARRRGEERTPPGVTVPPLAVPQGERLNLLLDLLGDLAA